MAEDLFDTTLVSHSFIRILFQQTSNEMFEIYREVEGMWGKHKLFIKYSLIDLMIVLGVKRRKSCHQLRIN